MYNERKDTFSIREILIQILCIILFIFLLIWLFPTKSYIKNNGGTASSQQVVDALFNSNVQTMKEAAVGYYTTARLPKKVGETSTITLGKMLEQKLILPFVDSNGKTCDMDNSYVQIVKEKDQYTMKVNLVCSSNSDYILVYLGCYDYCEGSICEKQTTETKKVVNVKKYKYVKTTEETCTWSDWSSWSTSPVTASATVNVDRTWVSTGGSYCTGYTDTYDYKEPIVKNVSNTTTGSKVTPQCNYDLYNVLLSDLVTCAQNASVMYDTTKTCPSGYKLNSNKSLCISTTSKALSADQWVITNRGVVFKESKVSNSSVHYLNEVVRIGVNSCNGCEYSINYIYDLEKKQSASCPSDYPTLIDGRCYKTTSYTTKKGEAYCDESMDFRLINYNGTLVCQDKESGLKSTCPSGTSRGSDGYCYKKTTTTTTTKECPTGYNFTDSTKTKCSKVTGSSCSSYSGSSGYYSYRYQTKTCTPAKTEVKYSTSKSDSSLTKIGYKLVKTESKG